MSAPSSEAVARGCPWRLYAAGPGSGCAPEPAAGAGLASGPAGLFAPLAAPAAWQAQAYHWGAQRMPNLGYRSAGGATGCRRWRWRPQARSPLPQRPHRGGSARGMGSVQPCAVGLPKHRLASSTVLVAFNAVCTWSAGHRLQAIGKAKLSRLHQLPNQPSTSRPIQATSPGALPSCCRAPKGRAGPAARALTPPLCPPPTPRCPTRPTVSKCGGTAIIRAARKPGSPKCSSSASVITSWL